MQQRNSLEHSGWCLEDAAQPCWPPAFPTVGIGYAGVALAFGLTVLTMAFAIGHISGCHLNPAVSLGLVVGKRFSASELLPYVIAQVAGAIAAAGVLYVIASGSASFDVHAGFASNGYGANSPGGYSLLAGFVAEVVLTAFFLIVIMGATDGRAPKGFAPIAIGLCLTLIHLVGIPVTNISVNPARSTGPAIFAGGGALQQLWMFWVAPLIGGAIGGGIYTGCSPRIRRVRTSCHDRRQKMSVEGVERRAPPLSLD